MWALWRNGSASDSRSEGYVFKSHWGQGISFVGYGWLGLVQVAGLKEASGKLLFRLALPSQKVV